MFRLLVLLLVSEANAAMLSSVQLPSTGQDAAFVMQAVGGISKAYSVANAAEGQQYYVPPADVNFMFSMVSNPSAYTSHGPLWVSAKSGNYWTSFYDALSYSHEDPGFAGTPVATIVAAGSVLETPWQAVRLVRGGGLLTVSIYDTPVPEPDMLTSITVLALSCWCWLIEVRIRRKS